MSLSRPSCPRRSGRRRRQQSNNCADTSGPTLFRLLGLQGLTLLAVLAGATAAAAGEITATSGAMGLGTRVNGGSGCSSGACLVTGGTGAGRNLFHRFNAFDTRGAITGVTFQNTGFSGVMVGVLSPTVIDKTVRLSQPGSLFWLSPGGISLQAGGNFQNVTNLSLSTATGLRVGTGLFDAWRTTAEQAALLSGAPVLGRPGLVSEADTLGGLGLLTNGDLSVDGGLLTVEQSLLLDAQGGHVLLDGARIEVAGGSVGLHGEAVRLNQSAVDVSAQEGVGGQVRLEGGAVHLFDSSVNAAGGSGGGQVLVGGDERGSNPDVRNARVTTVDAASSLQADALHRGDGGRVIVYATDAAEVAGRLSVRGGSQAGNGGFVETSAGYLEVFAAPDLSAPAGSAGTWLIDPYDITISAASDSNIFTFSDGGIFYQPTASGSTLSVGTLTAALDQGGTVIVDTTGSGTEAGNITVSAPISTSAGSTGATLELRAHNDINLNSSISSTASALDLTLLADQDASGQGRVNWGGAATTVIDLQGGQASIKKGGFVAATDGDLVILSSSSGAAVLAANSTLQTGSLTLSSGTLLVDGSLNATNTYTQSGGTLTGPGTLTINGDSFWSGGTITGSGSLDVAFGSTLTLDGGLKYLGDRTINNDGTIDWVAGNIQQVGNSVINNSGFFAVNNGSSDVKLSNDNIGTDANYTTVINNALGASLIKSGAATATFGGGFPGVQLGFVDINNDGTLDVQSGTLNILGSSVATNSSGTFQTTSTDSSTPTLLLSSGTFNLNNGASITGSSSDETIPTGITRLDGATLVLVGASGIDSPPAPTANAFDIASGTLTGPGTLTINGDSFWSGGTITGSGSLDVAFGSTLTLDGGLKYLGDRTINNDGTIDWVAGNIQQVGNSVINNSGFFAVNNGSSDVKLSNDNIGTDANYTTVINNALGASLIKSGAATATFGGGFPGVQLGFVDINNDGTLDVQSGTLNILGSSVATNSSGTFQTTSTDSSTPTLLLSSGTFNLNNGASITGSSSDQTIPTGITRLDGATLVLVGASGIDSPPAPTANAFDIASGTLTGPGTLTINGDSFWSGGTITGSGSLDVAFGSTLTLDGGLKYLGDRTINNDGTIDWVAGNIQQVGNSVINNSGFFAVNNGSSDVKLSNDNIGTDANYTTVINNALGASLIKSGAATATFGGGFPGVQLGFVDINNDGTLDVQSGTLNILGSSVATNSSGTFQTTSTDSSTPTLLLSSGTFNLNNGASITGSSSDQTIPTGITRLDGATLVLVGASGIDSPPAPTANAFDIASGTLTGPGTLTINGDSFWSGGTITGSGSLDVAFGSTLTLDGGLKYLGDRTINNDGTIDWVAGNIQQVGNSVINNSGFFAVNNGSSDVKLSNDNIGTDANYTTVINNALGASLIKSGAATATFGGGFPGVQLGFVDINNDGTLDVQSGTLNILGSSVATNSSGTFQTTSTDSSTPTLLLSSGTFNLNNGASITGSSSDETIPTGITRLDGATLVLVGASGIDSPPAPTANAFDIASGTLTGPGTLTINGDSFWSGGTITGSGSLDVAFGSTLTLDGGLKYLGDRTINNDGTIDWVAGNIQQVGNSVINNSGFFAVNNGSSDVKLSNDNIGTDANYTTVINNALGASLIKSGAATATFGGGFPGVQLGFVDINNDGTLDVQSGTLNILGSSVATNSSGTFQTTSTASSTPTLLLSSGTFNLNNGASITGSSSDETIPTGITRLDGATLVLVGASGIDSPPAPTANAFDIASGTLTGPGTLTINGDSFWSGGDNTIFGLTVNSSGSLAITGGSLAITGTTNLDGALTVAGGTANLSGPLQGSSGAVTVQGGSLSLNGASTIGSFEMSAGTASIGSTASIDAYTQSGGTLSGSGTLTLTGTTNTWSGGTLAGNLTVDSGATLDINGTATKVLDSGTLNNNGTVTWSGGQILTPGTSSSTVNNYGLFDIQGDLTWGKALYNGNGYYNSSTTVFNNAIGATLQKSAGSAVLLLGSLDTYYIAPGYFDLNNAGTVSIAANTGSMRFFGGGTGTSSGVFQTGSNATLDFSGGTQNLTSTSSFIGAGGLSVSGATFSDNGSYSATGLISISAGTANLSPTGTSSTPIGALSLTGGTLNLNTASTAGSFSQSGGTLSGIGTLTLTGAANTWSGGTLAGNLTVDSGATLDINGTATKVLDSGTLNNNGTVTWSGGQILTPGTSSSTVNNYGLFDIQGDLTWGKALYNGNGYYNSSTTVFNNAIGATLQKSAGSAVLLLGSLDTYYIAPGYFDLNNAGTVSIAANTGSMRFFGGGTGTSSGVFQTGSNATLDFSGGTQNLTSTSSFIGAGGLSVSGATFSDNGSYSATGLISISAGTANLSPTGTSSTPIGALSLTGGTLNLNTASTAGSFSQSGGTLSGIGTLTLTGAANTWSGGTLAGNLTVDSGATLDINGTATKVLDSGTLNNNGTVTWSGGQILTPGTSSSTVNNYGLFDIQGDLTWGKALYNGNGYYNSSTTVFNNAIGATLQKSAGSAVLLLGSLDTYYIAPGYFDLNNAGTVSIAANTGSMRFFGGGTGTSSGVFQTGSNATLDFSGGTQNLTSTSSFIGAGGLSVSGATFSDNGSYSATGLISISAGTANLSPTGTSSTPIGALSLTGGTLNLNTASTAGSFSQSGGTLSGIGTLTLTGAANTWSGGTLAGNLTVDSGATLDINGTATKVLDSGTLNNNGTVTWSGGQILTPGTSSSTVNNYGLFDIQGDLTWGKALYNGNGYYNSSTTVFNNAIGATLQKSAGSAVLLLGSLDTYYIAPGYFDLNNAGTVSIAANTGSMRFFGGGTGTSSGVFQTGSNATLDFSGGTQNLTSTSSFIGAGGLSVSGATFSDNGSYSATGLISISAGTANLSPTGTSSTPIGALSLTGGTLNLNTASTAGSFSQSGGTLSGIGTLTLTGAANTWSGGTLAGNLTVDSGATLDINGTATKVLDSGTLNNNGTVTWSGGQILTPGTSSSTVNNYGLFDIQGDLTWGKALYNGNGYYNSSTTVFNNAIGATLQKSAGSAVLLLGSLDTYYSAPGYFDLNNSGAVSIAANTGTMSLYSTSLTQAGLIQVGAGSVFQRTGGFTNLSGGTLAGAGAFDVGNGTLTNAGTISPGGAGSVGALSILGNAAFTSTSILALDLGGTAPGQSDQLAVTGNVALGGTINAALLGGYTPFGGDVVSVVSGTRSGSTTYATANLPTDFVAGYGLADGEVARLIYTGGASLAFTNTEGNLDWSSALNWSGGALPGPLDLALITDGYSVAHSTGIDTVGSLSISKNNSLTVSGGSLTVLGTTTLGGSLTTAGGTATLSGALNGSNGSVTLQSGSLNLNAASMIGTFTQSGGTLGGSGTLTVSQDFQRTGGIIDNTLSGVSIAQASGDLSPGELSVGGPVSLTTLSGNLVVGDVVSSNGAMTISVSGDLFLDAASAGRAVGLTSTGTQDVSATNVFLLGGASGSGVSALMQSGGDQSVIASNGISILGGAGGTGNSAYIQTDGLNQSITVGAGGLSLVGGSGVDGNDLFAAINHYGSGVQALQLNDGGSISLQGGSATGAGGELGNQSYAQIFSGGSGQSIAFSAGTAAAPGGLTLTGGGSGSNNYANVQSEGLQSITGVSTITITGGAYGSDNWADIGTNGGGLQTISASSIQLAGGGGTLNTWANGAGIGSYGEGARQIINLNSGSLSLQGGNGPSGNYAYVSSGGDQTISGVSNLTVTGGTAGSSNRAFILSGGQLELGDVITFFDGSGSQSISAGSISMVGGASGTDNYAEIAGIAAQNINSSGVQATGGGGTGNYSAISAYGSTSQQTITLASGPVTIVGGSGPSQNSASLFTNGSQSISGVSALTITGGTLGTRNEAYVSALAGPQYVSASSILLQGGASGTENTAWLDVGPSGLQQTITTTGNVSLIAGAGGAGNGAILEAPLQNLSVGGALSLQGGGSTATANYEGMARIGGVFIDFAGGFIYNTATSSTINVAGDVTLSGGSTATSGAAIGNVIGGTGANDIALTSTGGSITLNPGAGGVRIGNAAADTLTGGSIALSAASGSISSNGSAATPTPIRTAGAMSLSAGSLAIGSSIEGGSVTLTAASGGIDLGGSVAGGSAGPVVIQASGDVNLGAGAAVSSTAAGDAIVVAAGGNFINLAGSAALSASIGRWLVYSTDPAVDNRGGLAYDFKHYGQTYGGSTYAGPGVGKGFLYTIAPTITPELTGSLTKTYDGNTTAILTAANYITSGVIDGDLVVLNNPTVGTYNSKNVLEANSVSVGGQSIASATDSADNAPVYGYTLTTDVVSATGSITAKGLSATLSPQSKEYDGSTTALLSPEAFNLSGFIGSESATINQTLGIYNSANVVEASSVSTSLTSGNFSAGSGTLLSNYSLPAGASGSGSISTKALIVGITPQSKVYDGSTTALLSPDAFNLSGFIGSESATINQTLGIYNSANVVEASSVSTSLTSGNFSAGSGTLLSNYSLPAGASGSGSISTKALSVGITPQSKVYDGSTTALLSPEAFNLSGFIGSESATINQTLGIYNSANVVEASSVSTSLTSGNFSAGSGTLLSNYSLPAGASGSGSISTKALSVGITPQSKVYDGSTTALLSPEAFNLSGFIGSESATINQTLGIYNSANVVEASSVSTSLTSGNFSAGSGTLLSNYSLPAGASGSGSISTKALSVGITPQSKVYDGSTTALLSPDAFNLSGFIGSESATINQTLGIYNSANVVEASSVSTSLTSGNFSAGSGTLLSNYSLPAGASGSGSISTKALIVGITPQSKVYDGSTTALLSPDAFNLSGFIGSESATINQTLGIYNSANVVEASSVSTSLTSGNFSAGSGTLLSNYSLPAGASGSGSIRQRPLSTWSGRGGNLLWSNPLNWDALPSFGNVAAVSIPSSVGTVTYDSTAGATTLSARSQIGSLQINSGVLNANGGLQASGLTIIGGQLSGSGELFVNGFYSQSGGVLSGFSAVDLRQNSAAAMLLGGGSMLSPGARFSMANLGGPVSLSNVLIDASGAANGGQIDLNGTKITLNSAQLITSGANDGGSIRLGLGSPLLNGLASPLPTRVSIVDSSLVADPPAVGGVIGIDGTSISIAGSLLNVFGFSGGSVQLGSSNTSLLSLDSATTIELGKSASQAYVVGPGGTLLNQALVTIDGQSVLQPDPVLAPSLLPALEASLSQAPLNEDQWLSPDSAFASVPLEVFFDPRLEPAVAMTLEESAFLYSDGYATIQLDESSQSAQSTQSLGATQESNWTLVENGQSATGDRDENPDNEGKGETAQNLEGIATVELELADKQTTQALTSSSLSSRSSTPVNSSSGATAATMPAAESLVNSSSPISTVLATQRSTGQAGVAPTAGTSTEIRASVSTVSSAQAAERFSQSEARAQMETAEKLGLAGGAGTPPTPAQIQGLLQRVMQLLRGSSSSMP